VLVVPALLLAVAACAGATPVPSGGATTLPAATASDVGASPTARPTPAPRPTPDPAVGQPAPAVPIARAGSEFAAPGDLDGWRLTQGEPMDGGASAAEVAEGVLRVTAAQSSWIRTQHGFGLARVVEGDIAATARIRALGRDADEPSVDWSLAGLMLRAPTIPGGRENWVHVSVGRVSDSVVERKTTQGSESRLSLIPVPAGWTELRLVRAGDAVLVLHRASGEEWVLDFTYQRPDLPAALEVLLTAQTGGESDRGDLVAEYDWLRLAESPLDAATVAALEAGNAKAREVLAQLAALDE
jgi:hypothetical protein